MGYEANRFQGDVDEELICPICSGVLEEPSQVEEFFLESSSVSYNMYNAKEVNQFGYISMHQRGGLNKVEN